MSEVILTVNGARYGGWTRVEIRSGIEQISSTFSLGLTERWSDRAEAWPIRQGDACTVAAGGEILITGYVDDVLPSFDNDNHGITVVGRDKTGDLVDCSAIAESGEFHGRDLLQIAEALVKPFKIKVSAETDLGAPLKRFSIQEGETVFEALERAARMRGVLLISDGLGNLVITRAGSGRVGTGLVQGDNILSGRATYSLRERYKNYICKGQAAGFDTSTPEQNSGPRGEAADKNVGRYRPLLIVAEDLADSAGLKERALWEAAVRMGRSARPEITVQGWSHPAGLWRPNRLVPVRCPYLKLDRDLLIVGVISIKDEDGTKAVLELCRPEGFALLPVPETGGGI
jgi:prophage tail gpP-like protein